MPESRIGQQFGNYRLTRLLGKGGFADVYLGEHIYLPSQVAVKLLHTTLIAREQEEFLAEARTIATLDHPSIVRVLDCGIEHGEPFLIMNYAPNGTLRQRYPKGTRMPPNILLEYVFQVAEALQYAHDCKLIHRDIKPENMLLGHNDRLMLSDFGIALISSSLSSQSTKAAMGTVTYMAPEQVLGKPRVASDQYALGVVVYEWLCGERPFRGTFTELCTQHLYAPPPSLVEKVSTISPETEFVVMKALAKEPSERFATVLDFARALRDSYEPTLPIASPINIEVPSSGDSALVTIPRVTSAPENPVPVAFDHSRRIDKTYEKVGGIEENAFSTRQLPLVSSPSSVVSTGRARRKLFIIVSALLVLLTVISVFLWSNNLLFSTVSKQPVRIAAPLSPIAKSTPTAQLTSTPQSTSTPQPTPTSQSTSIPQPIVMSTPTSTPIATCNSIDATKLSPAQLYDAATTSCPLFYSANLSQQDNANWEQFTYSAGGGCSFASGGYVATMPNMSYVAECLEQTFSFSDFAFQAQMTIQSGANADGGGLIFRSTSGGEYRLRVAVDGSYDLTTTSLSGTSSAIKTGVNQTNLLTVIAQGSLLSLYVNKQCILQTSSTASSQGRIGLMAVAWSQPVNVTYTNAQVWKL